MFQYFISTLPHFIAYFGAAALLAIAFLGLYVLITPHRELTLIRDGNAAAAIQLVGSFLGFAAPVATVIANSVSVPDMLLWGAVATVVQLLTFYLIAGILFRDIAHRITDRCMASGVFTGGIALGAGILQAACMVP